MTKDVVSRRSLLVGSSGLMRRLSFIATRALPKSFIVFNLTLFDRPVVKDFSDCDVGNLLLLDDGGLVSGEMSEAGDDDWMVDEMCDLGAFLIEEPTAVVCDDPISVEESAQRLS